MPDELTQFSALPGVIDLAWGQPDPKLLPLRELRAAAARAFDRYRADALAYGNPAGPPPLRRFIRARLSETDALAPEVEEIVVTAGTSQGFDLVATLFIGPADVVLVAEPTYHLALKILGDHPIRVRGVRSDGEGIDLDALARAVRSARGRGRRERRVVLYTIPTFNNPTGASLPDARRRALVKFAAAEGLLIVEDDTYRELAYEGSPPPSLWAVARQDPRAGRGTVIRLGSFAKSVAPGLRVGYLTADAPTAERIAASGLLDSGGSPAHLAALIVAEYAAAGDYARVVERYRRAYRERRDRLMASLRRNLSLPAPADLFTPAGGYFVWLDLPRGLSTGQVAQAALRTGVGFMPADAFFLDGSRAPGALRLAFSRYPPAQLEEAGARLAAAIAGCLRQG